MQQTLRSSEKSCYSISYVQCIWQWHFGCGKSTLLMKYEHSATALSQNYPQETFQQTVWNVYKKVKQKNISTIMLQKDETESKNKLQLKYLKNAFLWSTTRTEEKIIMQISRKKFQQQKIKQHWPCLSAVWLAASTSVDAFNWAAKPLCVTQPLTYHPWWTNCSY